MDKLKLHSPNLTQDNIARIRELLPNCVAEAKDGSGQIRLAVDFDQLKQELSETIVEGPQERYHLNWPGKREALLTANAPIAKTLRPCREESVNFDTTKNLFIEGDNLDALKLLQETYLGKVKIIYIDPPYNTGNDFIYEDDFAEDAEEFLAKSNQKDELGNKLAANTEANGRFHSDWLSMISARLRLAKNLLKEDGAIFVSCDEGEHPRLRLVMDEIFGQNNFIADLVWAAGRKNDSRFISISHEYIICYATNVQYLKDNQVIWRQRKKGIDEIYNQFDKCKRIFGDDCQKISSAMKEWYKSLPDGNPAKLHKHYSEVDSKGLYFPDNISSVSGGSRPRYEIPHPVTKKPVTVPGRGWGYTLDTLMKLIAEDRVDFGADHTCIPTLKSYLKDREYQTPYSVFYQDGRAASKRLRVLMEGDIFDFPKDELVIQEIIQMVTSNTDIILDFFAGSSTTAHAAMQQNAEDSGKRQFIMVQLPQSCDEKSEAYKAGYKNIAEISKERIRRAGKKIKEDQSLTSQDLDTGFRVLKVDTSNMSDVYYTPDTVKQDMIDQMTDNIKPDRTPEDLLFQVLLDWGVDLTLPIRKETINGKTVFFVNEQPYDLMACFDTNVTEDLIKELAGHKPLRMVFRDASFVSDDTKINAEQIFKQISPSTEVKAI
jgi:adenine-specific DNA-methyltransferase